MQQLSAAALALEASLAQQLDGLPTKARPLILLNALGRRFSLPIVISLCSALLPLRSLPAGPYRVLVGSSVQA